MICKVCRKSFRPNPKAPISKVKFCSFNCRLNHYRKTQRELARTEWYSPKEIVEAARTVMGRIDLDPASCQDANRIVKAQAFYSVRDNGLVQPWFGKVWLNPPYSRYAPKFIERFSELFAEGSIEQGVLLLGTHHLNTEWINPLMSHRPIVCIPPKRLQFSDSTIRPAHGSVIIGVGVSQKAFEQVFSSIGHIWLLNKQIMNGHQNEHRNGTTH